MQTALWPATLGYCDKMLLRRCWTTARASGSAAFLTRYVSGRGAVPAIRIGRQPYGILPTTAHSRIGWRPAGPAAFAGLAQRLGARDADWAAMAPASPASAIGRDPHATLLDILGLHPRRPSSTAALRREPRPPLQPR